MSIVKQASVIVECAAVAWPSWLVMPATCRLPKIDAGRPECSAGPTGPGSLCYVIGMKNFWLVKQEPSSYSWSDFVAEGQTSWTGVRNYTARNNLRRMEKSDEALFYHSGEDKAVVGIAKVIRTAYRDSTAKEGDWSDC